jgi:hypothetical protein
MKVKIGMKSKNVQGGGRAILYTNDVQHMNDTQIERNAIADSPHALNRLS